MIEGNRMLTTSALRDRLAQLISEASDGTVSTQEVLTHEHELSALGIPSLSQLRAIDAIENEFGATLDLEADDTSYLDSIKGLTAYLVDQGLVLDD
ncbi:MAG: hypothetical protein QOF58_6685 [Pseudonocardiales bacterium]|jgi:acyl carrier protein|nr:hypothetical protein [Pseudonocardiales bacterium]